MSQGYDQKWGLVVAMSYLEGISGATLVASERGATFTVNNCSVSTAVSRWGRGSMFFPAESADRSILIGGVTVRVTDQHAIQGSFYSTDVSGNRFILGIGNRISLLVQNGTLYLVVRTSSASDPSYVVAAPSPVQAGRWYDYTIRTNSTGFSLELDGAVVASALYGGETDGGVFTSSRLGNQGVTSAAASWNGYLGPFRWTIGDQRLEDSGKPAYRFPVLGAVDPHREKVVFHSHCEPTENGVPRDEKGNDIAVIGGAPGITTAWKKYGIGGLSINGGLRIGPNPAFILGTNDFTLEFDYVYGDNASITFRWIFQFLNPDGSLAFGAGSSQWGSSDAAYVKCELTTLSAEAIFQSPGRVVFSRRGRYLYIYRNGLSTPYATMDIGEATSIGGDGYFYLGYGDGGSGSNGRLLVIDEPRLTIGGDRGTGPVYPVSTEKYSDFGPRSLSGTVIDPDGNPLVRTVRAYHRITGRMVSETTSAADGTWALPVADTGDHFVVVHDDVKNALIFDRVKPVLIT